MIETSPKNNNPEVFKNPISALKIIILPLCGFIFIVISIAVLIFSQISAGQQSILNWVNICISIISLLFLFPGLFFFILILGLIAVLNKSRRPLYSGLRKTQQYTFKTSKMLTHLLNMILKPVFFLNQLKIFIAGLRFK
jgi:hypothetical protein